MSQIELPVDDERVKRIAHACRHIDSFLYSPAPISSLDVLRMPGVVQSKPLDLEQLKTVVTDLLAKALDSLVTVREREGQKLAQTSPEILQQWREKLVSRLNEAKLELDQDRLEQEMVYLAQKTDVAEEIDRLSLHIAEVKRVLDADKPVGRRLDFLMQELNREANTLSSKSADTETTQAAVEMKVLIEQMREQIQNIE